MKRIIGLVLFIGVALSGCSNPSQLNVDGPQVARGTGTVRQVGLEGGFFGIVGDDGQRLDPRNLPAKFQSDGLRVVYDARIDTQAASGHMWGEVVDLVSIDHAP